MVYSVKQYAQHLGVSRSAAYKAVRSGRVGAYRAGVQWVVPEAAVALPKPASRPMAPENAIQLLASLSGAGARHDDAVVRRRIAEKLDEVSARDFDPHRLWSWVRARGSRLALSASPADIPDLLEDARLARSGIADPRGGIAASRVAEGYVSPAAVDDLIAEYLLVESERPNVWLHVADLPRDGDGAVPIGFVIADLLDHGGPRERSQAEELLSAIAR